VIGNDSTKSLIVKFNDVECLEKYRRCSSFDGKWSVFASLLSLLLYIFSLVHTIFSDQLESRVCGQLLHAAPRKGSKLRQVLWQYSVLQRRFQLYVSASPSHAEHN
jgi:hypothetical protein